MREIVEWLAALEERACRIYADAAHVFGHEPTFAAFLKDLSVDEMCHAQFMLIAAEYVDELTRCQKGIALDPHTRDLIETPFRQARERVEEGSLTRDEMAEFIIRMELSEWNDFFLYVVSSLKDKDRRLMQAVARIQQHRNYILKMLCALPDGKERLKPLTELAPLWNERALVVDDFEPVAQMVATICRREGFDTQTAPNGRDALRLVNEAYFDVILSDIVMPVMDGMRFFEEALKTDADIGRRFIFLTGALGGMERAFIGRHGLRCIEKPTGIPRIAEALREIVCWPSVRGMMDSQAAENHPGVGLIWGG